MRVLCRASLVAMLIGTLINAPVYGSPLKPSGTITQAETTWIDRTVATVGTTVYPGDTLRTEDSGSVRIRSGLAQFYMMSGSEARVEDAQNGIRATVLKGTAGFSSGPSDIVELNALNVRIRSLDGQPAHGRVSIAGATQLVVTSFKGPFEVSIDGDTHTIPDGTSYRVSIVPDDSKAQSDGTGTLAVRNRKKLLLDVLIGAALVGGVVVGAWVYYELCESNSTPSQQ
jgi:hypothetical protein